jgi:hypothetical protein
MKRHKNVVKYLLNWVGLIISKEMSKLELPVSMALALNFKQSLTAVINVCLI